jgi:hypothetical protein
MMGGMSEEHSILLNTFQEPHHYIHDEMIIASPFHGSDDGVSIIPTPKNFLKSKMERRMW